MRLHRFLALAALVAVPALADAQEFTIPADYPPDYQQLIDGSRAEDRVLIYSNVSTTNFGPFIDLAKQRFPWITIETTDENSLWEKFFAEIGAGVRSADIVLDTSPERWVDFAERSMAEPYVSPETPNLPDWSLTAGPGIYAASADPFIMAYNRRAFEGQEAPRSVEDVAAALAAHPDLRGDLATYDPTGAIGMALWNSWYTGRADADALLAAIGPRMRPESSAGTMREKVTTGEYAVAIFTSGAGIRQYEQAAVKALVGWVFPSDGTPVLQRSVAISAKAQSPNSARLILDLLLSRDGQIAFAQGGQTPYRSDIAPEDVPFASYTGIVRDIGEENIILIRPAASLLVGREEFLAVWNAALGR